MTRIVSPTYGSFKPISLITLSTPIPTAPAISSLPSFNGSITCGLATYPFTLPLGSAVTVIEPIGPSDLIWIVTRSASFFIIDPIITPPVNSLPSATAPIGLILCLFLASSHIFVVEAANALICPSAAIPLITISFILSIPHFLNM